MSKLINSLAIITLLAPVIAQNHRQEQILHAIHIVESGGRMNPPAGDGGKAIGPFQIHRAYWQDATEGWKPRGTYQDCLKYDYSKKVVIAYMNRYVKDDWINCRAEMIARTHNGGPRGAYKVSTVKYWKKVEEALKTIEKRK